MILEREEISWTCGKNHNITRRGFRYRVQCDNPDCGKIFYRQDKQVKQDAKRGRSNQYCNFHCLATHFAGVCEHPGCDEKYTHQSMVRGLGDRLCQKHSIRINGKERAVKYRKRDKKELYDRLGNRCACCGERDSMYLEIDHVHNDGTEHREKINANWGAKHMKATSMHPRYYIRYLTENPGGLQLLCSNCNRAKHRNGGELYRPAKFTRRQLIEVTQ